MKMMGKTDLLVLIGLILSLILFLTFATQNTSQQNQTILENQRLIKLALNASQQNSELILQNQQAIKAALNTTVSNSESLNRTQQAILHVNDNLLTVYTKLLNLTNAIDVNSHSNRAMTVQNREMLNFLRASFDDEFMAELLQDRKMKQDSLDLILTRLANMSADISALSPTPPR